MRVLFEVSFSPRSVDGTVYTKKTFVSVKIVVFHHSKEKTSMTFFNCLLFVCWLPVPRKPALSLTLSKKSLRDTAGRRDGNRTVKGEVSVVPGLRDCFFQLHIPVHKCLPSLSLNKTLPTPVPKLCLRGVL